MENLQIEIGDRIKQARQIINEGHKLSLVQLAEMLGETRDRLFNYENGRSAVPNHILVNLYQRGINPIYILTGEQEIFATNASGIALKLKVEANNKTKNLNILPESNVAIIPNSALKAASIDELINHAAKLTAAAGDIWKLIQSKQDINSKTNNE